MPNIFNINQKVNKKVISKFLNYENNLAKFFNIKINHVNIFFLKSRKELDLILGRKTEDWLVAFTGYGSIFILDPKVYYKQSSHKDMGSFWQTLNHECCHLFYYKLAGVNFPKWLDEGFACYLAGQVKKKPTKEEVLKVFEYFKKSDWQIYNIGYFWVKLLIEKFGKEKMLKLLKILDHGINEEKFKRNFYKVYKISYDRGVFNELLKMG